MSSTTSESTPPATQTTPASTTSPVTFFSFSPVRISGLSAPWLVTEVLSGLCVAHAWRYSNGGLDTFFRVCFAMTNSLFYGGIVTGNRLLTYFDGAVVNGQPF